MAEITLKGTPIHTVGNLPETGSPAPDFRLTSKDLTDVSLSDYSGRYRILNITPSLDTRVCGTSAKQFNERIKQFSGVVVLNVSRDLPFAQARFCESNNVDTVVTLSQLRDGSFGQDYGVTIVDGPFEGLLARAVVVIDDKGTVVYTELVPEISQEPDYDSALSAIPKSNG